MDIYLQQLLMGNQGKNPLSKDPFELAIEQEARRIAESTISDELLHDHPLVSRTEMAATLTAETLANYKLTDLEKFFLRACEILKKEGKLYLNAEKYQTLIGDLKAVYQDASKKLNFSEEIKLTELQFFTDSSAEALYSIAVAKFNESHFTDSLALFALLSTLQPERLEFWYRLGIAAQRSDKFELALKAFSIITSLPSDCPLTLGAKLFSAQCDIALGLLDLAKIELRNAKELVLEMNDTNWVELIQEIEQDIAVA